MSDELPLIIAVLARLAPIIKQPFWAFSTEVSPAIIKGRELQTRSTGGTSLTCVLAHIAEQRPTAAVIITDGFVETVDRRLLTAIRNTHLHVIVTRRGATHAVRAAGLRYTQLGEVPR
jgi:hypothetical protein